VARHPGCRDVKEKSTARPLEARLDVLSTVNAAVDGDPNKAGDAHPFHWQDFARQNAIARDLAARFRVSFLDVADATSFRQVRSATLPLGCPL
jgi:hypothetical protein